MTKLCKDCKHYRKDWIQRFLLPFDKDEGFSDKCVRPRPVSLVTGKDKITYCDIERGVNYILDNCGPDGKYWEQRGH